MSKPNGTYWKCINCGYAHNELYCPECGSGTSCQEEFYDLPKPLSVTQIREHWQVAKVLDMLECEVDFSDFVLLVRDIEALHGIT